MDKPELFTEDTILYFLKELKGPNDDKNITAIRSFADVVRDNWIKLGIPGESNPTLVENILIKAIDKMYPQNSKNTDAENRQNAKNRDSLLLAFGLLDGYYHTERTEKGFRPVGCAERYNAYLSSNTYIQLEYPEYKTYGECLVQNRIKNARVQSIESTKKSKRNQPVPLNTLTSCYTHNQKELGKKFLQLINSKEYDDCKESAEFDQDTGVRLDLPKPFFTLENFLPEEKITGVIPGSSEGCEREEKGPWEQFYPSGSESRANCSGILKELILLKKHLKEIKKDCLRIFLLFVALFIVAIILISLAFASYSSKNVAEVVTLAQIVSESGGYIEQENLFGKTRMYFQSRPPSLPEVPNTYIASPSTQPDDYIDKSGGLLKDEWKDDAISDSSMERGED